MINCCICNQDYAPMSGFEDTKQCFRCSAMSVRKDGAQYVFGYYGSQIADGKIYRVQRDRNIATGYVCDDCIEKMISNQTITCISESNFFGRG